MYVVYWILLYHYTDVTLGYLLCIDPMRKLYVLCV